MRQPADKRGRARKSTTYSIPAPTKGWNTLDSIAEMGSQYAVVLQNYIPTSSSVVLRSGSTPWVTGLGGRVETMAVYNKGATSKLFAAVSGSIYDVTSSGVAGAPVVTGKASARWQFENFATPGGQFLTMVNGADTPQYYDGTTWANQSLTNASLANSNLLINVKVHQNRLWYIEANSLRVYYLPVSTITGAMTLFDMSSIFPRGGYLMAMGDWTIDSGQGMDDYAVFISSEGEVAVYRGTDPSTAATWFLIGIYQIGSPVGRRCLVKFASDLLIINQDGLQLMSAALSSSRVSIQSSVTDKIQPSITNAIGTYGTNFGWESFQFTPGEIIALNIPVTNGSQQFVMNTKTKGWCQFTGWDASTFEVMKDVLYFGTTGMVMKAFTGTSDNGGQINGACLQAFSPMGTSNLKQFLMARPILSTDVNSIGILLGLNVDYNTRAPLGTPTFTSGTVGLWDTALWDAGIWGGDLAIKKDWQTVGSIGHTGALYIKTSSTTANIQWAATDYIFEVGSGFY